MNCIIIDDEATARLVVEELCLQLTDFTIAASFSKAIEAVKYLNQNSDIDLIFLDIHMPDFTGIDFIETIKDPPKIILTTSDSNFAIQAFEYDCIVDYLVKPIAPQRFQKAMSKFNSKISNTTEMTVAERELGTLDNQLYVNINKRLVKINIPSIYLIEAKGDYINIVLDDKTYIVHSTLKKIEEKLPQDLFLKIHRSFIINTSTIIDIKDNSVLIKKRVIPVSRSNKSELMKRLNLL
jgi:DNA-binding LytR/AlgR family response regulator